jgi:hypothetical protein
LIKNKSTVAAFPPSNARINPDAVYDGAPLLQITRTLPLRRTILQLRQIFLTDARTFMVHLFRLNAGSLRRP